MPPTAVKRPCCLAGLPWPLQTAKHRRPSRGPAGLKSSGVTHSGRPAGRRLPPQTAGHAPRPGGHAWRHETGVLNPCSSEGRAWTPPTAGNEPSPDGPPRWRSPGVEHEADFPARQPRRLHVTERGQPPRGLSRMQSAWLWCPSCIAGLPWPLWIAGHRPLPGDRSVLPSAWVYNPICPAGRSVLPLAAGHGRLLRGR